MDGGEAEGRWKRRDHMSFRKDSMYWESSVTCQNWLKSSKHTSNTRSSELDFRASYSSEVPDKSTS